MSSYLKLNADDNTYVSFADADVNPLGANKYSFVIWVRIGNRSVSTTLFQKFDGIKGYQVTLNEEDNGDLSLEFLLADTIIRTVKIDNIPVKLNEWQLFVFTAGSLGNEMKIYIDGVFHADTGGVLPPSVNVDSSDVFYMGIDPTNPSSSSLGRIDVDSFSFYVGLNVLNETEIRALYNQGRGRKIDITEPDIVFGLNFDEGTGATVNNIVPAISTGTISSDASSFDTVWSETGGVAVMLPSDIKMYLTSLEPDLEQMNYSQSIGGHISESLLYPETTLASALGLYDTSITLTDATDLIGYNYLSAINEIIKVGTISSVNVTATERGVNGAIGYYPSGTYVQGVSSPLNDSFNVDREQYRCYAVKNTSDSESAYNLSVFFSQLSENTNTTMKLALEIPKSQGITGVSTSWTSSMLIDSSIAGTYDDNFFTESYITFEDSPNAGEKRRISSYDGTTGTFVFADSLPLDYDSLVHSSSINYTVDASPAQRVKSGVDAPADTDYITAFSEASSRDNAVTLSQLEAEGNLLFGEIIYIWIEREIGKSSDPYEENSFVLSIDFEKELEGQ